MFDNIFGGIGKGCASHPWEVIVGVLTVTACMLSMDKTSDPSMSAVPPNNNPPHNAKIVVSKRSCLNNAAIDLFSYTYYVRCLKIKLVLNYVRTTNLTRSM